MAALRVAAYIVNAGLTLFALWSMHGHGGSWIVGLGVMAAVAVNVFVLSQSGGEKSD